MNNVEIYKNAESLNVLKKYFFVMYLTKKIIGNGYPETCSIFII